jgi:hypothetical protein
MFTHSKREQWLIINHAHHFFFNQHKQTTKEKGKNNEHTLSVYQLNDLNRFTARNSSLPYSSSSSSSIIITCPCPEREREREVLWQQCC